MTRRTFDLTPAELEAAAAQVAAILAEWKAGREEGPVLRRPDPEALRASLARPLPREGAPLPELLEELRREVVPHGRRNDSPRFLGYVGSGGSDAGAIADFLASGLNQNVTSWRSSPAAAEIERLVIDWLREILGLPEGTEGLLLGGGSGANLAALAVARDVVAGADVAAGGLLTVGREMTLYASEEVHMSIPRAASLLGLGREALRVIPCTPAFTIDVKALRERIAEDREEGRLPFCVVANAGSTNTGAIDPLEEISDLCRREGLWLHADGAYGGFAALAPGGRQLLAGLDLADSVTVDPHKWLHVPYDCGALLVRDRAALRAPFTEVGEYARVTEPPGRAAYAFFEHGMDLSRRFRALKVWVVLRHAGVRGLGESVESDLALARQLAAAVEAAPDLELMAPVPLSAVCFRYAPDRLDEGVLDDLNRKILATLHEEGRVYPTQAILKGRFALRACILSPQTSEADLDLLLSEVRRHGRTIRALAG